MIATFSSFPRRREASSIDSWRCAVSLTDSGLRGNGEWSTGVR
jgi:hypothetical protein